MRTWNTNLVIPDDAWADDSPDDSPGLRLLGRPCEEHLIPVSLMSFNLFIRDQMIASIYELAPAWRAPAVHHDPAPDLTEIHVWSSFSCRHTNWSFPWRTTTPARAATTSQ